MIPVFLLSLPHTDFHECNICCSYFPILVFSALKLQSILIWFCIPFPKLQEFEVALYKFPVFRQNRNKGFVTLKFWEEATGVEITFVTVGEEEVEASVRVADTAHQALVLNFSCHH